MVAADARKKNENVGKFLNSITLCFRVQNGPGAKRCYAIFTWLAGWLAALGAAAYVEQFVLMKLP